jgi:hypothetical protein
MNYHLAVCIPKSSFESPIQGEPYIVAVPAEMKHFNKRCDFVRWVEDLSGPMSFTPILNTTDFLNMSCETKRVAFLPKAY